MKQHNILAKTTAHRLTAVSRDKAQEDQKEIKSGWDDDIHLTTVFRQSRWTFWPKHWSTK